MSNTGSSLPKFGEWDVNNPASSEGFTMIFNKARDEKKDGNTPGRQLGSEQPTAYTRDTPTKTTPKKPSTVVSALFNNSYIPLIFSYGSSDFFISFFRRRNGSSAVAEWTLLPQQNHESMSNY